LHINNEYELVLTSPVSRLTGAPKTGFVCGLHIYKLPL
jgi:hypothetical protein